MTTTFYEILDVPPDASTAAIEAAYRERLKETHPDVSDAADASEATQRLIEARDVLTDEDERARYDRLGHEAYVEGSDATADASDVAAAARRAGYGTETSSAAGADTDGPNANDDTTARDRARRERAARDRVGAGRARHSAETDTDTDTQSDPSAGATAEATEPTANAETSDRWDPGTTATSGFSGSGGTAWSSSASYTVRQTETTAGGSVLAMPTGRELTLFVITFALYPVMLFSALLPAFPLWVNATIGFCTLLLVGYLQSEPTTAVMMFGTWSLIATALLVTLNVGAFSLVGLLVLCGTWLPLGFSLLTASALRR